MRERAGNARTPGLTQTGKPRFWNHDGLPLNGLLQPRTDLWIMRHWSNGGVPLTEASR
jgi:hypothetical protein